MLLVVVAVQGCTSPRAPARDATMPSQTVKPPSAGSIPAAPTPVPQSPSAGPAPARLGGGPQGAAGASSQCLAQIEAFAESHSGSRVMLGQAAFAEDDRLVLTRMPRRTRDGTLVDGRASLPTPLVLGLSLGRDGCTIRLVEPGPADAAGGSTAIAGSASIAGSAPLPGCTCVALAR